MKSTENSHHRQQPRPNFLRISMLIRGRALIQFFCLQDGRLFEVGANSRLAAYSNRYGTYIHTVRPLKTCWLISFETGKSRFLWFKLIQIVHWRRSDILRASSPFGGYHEKYTRERHARGDATAPRLAPRGFAARSRVLTRLASLAQIGELARRLILVWK